MPETWDETLSDVKKIMKSKDLSKKITYSIYKLNTEISRIDRFLNNLKSREKELYNALIESKMRGDEIRASIYASEIAELRKIIRTLEVSKLSLEKTMLRLKTIFQLGDVAKAASQIEPIIREVKRSLGRIMPEMSLELEGVHESLVSAISELSSYTLGEPVEPYIYSTSSEAKKILDEAKVEAERRVKSKFPKP